MWAYYEGRVGLVLKLLPEGVALVVWPDREPTHPFYTSWVNTDFLDLDPIPYLGV